jgi:hypothetical protein
MKAYLPLFIALTAVSVQAQSLPAGMPLNPAGSQLPTNGAATLPAPGAGAMSNGAIQTPETLRQSQDSVNSIQSSTNRTMDQQEQRFRRNIQGMPPQAIPSQGIGIPDPMNPNPNVAPTTPAPLTPGR